MLVGLRNHCGYMTALRTAFKVHSLCICAHRVRNHTSNNKMDVYVTLSLTHGAGIDSRSLRTRIEMYFFIFS